MPLRMLQVYGPFPVPHQRGTNGRGKLIEKSDQSEFWKQAGAAALKLKQGCYLFAIRAGRGATPWYVGKAGKSFLQECFTIDKVNKYNAAMFKGKNGTPILYFVALPGRKKKLSAKIVKEAETFLIRTAKDANPRLINKSNTKPAKWGISGVVRSGMGKPAANVAGFRKMLSL